MPETKSIAFSYKEVVESLIRYNNIHEGLWDLYVEFGLGAANIASGPGEYSPAAIIPLKKIGIQK